LEVGNSKQMQTVDSSKAKTKGILSLKKCFSIAIMTYSRQFFQLLS